MNNKAKASFAALILGLAVACSAPVQAGTLPQATVEALQRALDDERQAGQFYASVIETFGNVRPFSNIIKAEQRHEAMLVGVMQVYGLTIPEDPFKDGTKPSIPVPATVAEACKVGVDAEIANRDLYDKQLLPAVAAYPDIVQIMTSLRDASDDNHLPAFRRCGGAR